MILRFECSYIWYFVASSMDYHRNKLWLPEELYVVRIIYNNNNNTYIYPCLGIWVSAHPSIEDLWINLSMRDLESRERQLFQIFKRHLLKTGTYFNRRQRQWQREGLLFWIIFDSFWNMSNCLSNFSMNDTWI